jgi:hypothetical protein
MSHDPFACRSPRPQVFASALRRFVACALAPLALFAAAPSPAPGVPASPTDDRVYALAGAWSCRSAEGALVRSTGVRDGDTVKVHDDMLDRDGKRASFDDRYTFDAVKRSWHVVSGLSGFTAEAAPWLDDRWTVEGVDVNTVGRRMTIAHLPDGDLRRTFSYENGPKNFVVDTVERCTPGTTPPPADACIIDSYPATTLEPGPVNARFVPRNPSPAVVLVVVSLNERSEVVGARVQSSPDPAFNDPALAATRASKFRTAIRNCKPISADFIFSVTFTSE